MKKYVGAIFIIGILLTISIWGIRVEYKHSDEPKKEISETTIVKSKSCLLGVVSDRFIDTDISETSYNALLVKDVKNNTDKTTQYLKKHKSDKTNSNVSTKKVVTTVKTNTTKSVNKTSNKITKPTNKVYKQTKKVNKPNNKVCKQKNKVSKPIVKSVKKPKAKPRKKATSKSKRKSNKKVNKSKSYSNNDLNILTKVIYGEASGQSWDFKVAVGSVVLNRVKSKKYPNSIKGVVFQKGQYACTWDGNYNKKPDKQTKRVAEYLLKNGSQLPSKVLYQAEFKQGKGVYKKVGRTYFCY